MSGYEKDWTDFEIVSPVADLTVIKRLLCIVVQKRDKIRPLHFQNVIRNEDL